MVSVLFVILAAICNAVMDKISFHYYKSIFVKYKPFFWYPQVSWKNKYINGNPCYGRRKFLVFNLHPAFTDAWHLFKSLMIVFLVSAIIFYDPIFCILIDFIIFGIAWNVVFVQFFNNIFKLKTT
jgi:hypothetical protein